MTLNRNDCPHLHVYRMRQIGTDQQQYHTYLCKSCDTVLLVYPKEDFYSPGQAQTMQWLDSEATRQTQSDSGSSECSSK